MVEEKVCKDYTQAMDEILFRIKNRKADLRKRTFLILPDNYTLYAEKKLCDYGGGYFDVNVVSFNRLFFKLCDAEPLGKEQAVMLIRSLLPELKLSCFVKSSRYRGFSEKIYDAIILLKKNGITPEDLRAIPSSKFRDIALIYERYLEKSGSYADSSSRIRLLKEAISDGFFANSDVYASNFDLVTADEKELLKYISESADNFVFTSCPANGNLESVTDNIEVMECCGAAEQLKEIAVRIADAAYKGVPYSDMNVVCMGPCRNHIKRIFEEYKIPYCLDYKYKFSSHPLPRFLIALFNVVKRGLRRKDVLELVKNPYFGISKAESDNFEFFCEKYAIDYKGFEESFEIFGDEKAVGVEDIRKKLIAEVDALKLIGKTSVRSADFYEYVSEVCKRKGEIGKKFDDEMGINSVEELLKTVKFISALAENADFTLLSEIFEDGIEAVEIALLPPLSGSVAVGDVTAFRGQHFRYMFIPDFNEDVLPVKSEESGIISDYDISAANLELITSSETNKRHCSELCMLLSSADKLFISYDKNLPSGKSATLKNLIAQKKVIVTTRDDELTHLYNDNSLLPFFAGVRPAAEELLLNAMSEYSLFGDIRGNVRDVAFPLFTALGEQIYRYSLPHEEEFLPREFAEKLFSSSVFSVSRLSAFYKCPYMHFITYGLRAKPAEKAEIGANDIGNILHKVAELFIKKYKGGDIASFVGELTQNVINEHAKKGLITKPTTLDFLISEAIKGCEVLNSHFSAGEFIAVGEEISFGYPDSRLKSFRLGTEAEGGWLCGKIDYMDVWKDRARIVDYKTGNADFDPTEVFYGTNLQLSLYSYVLRLNGYKPAAIFLFPFKINWNTEEKKLRFNGLFDRELLRQIDTHFDGSDYESKVIAAKVTTAKDGKQKLSASMGIDEKRLCSLGDYAKSLADRAVSLMEKGYIATAPYMYGRKTACRYCDCKEICRYSSSDGYRIQRRKKLENFTEGNDELDE